MSRFILCVLALGCTTACADRTATMSPEDPPAPAKVASPGMQGEAASPRARGLQPLAAEPMPASDAPATAATDYAVSRGRSIQWKRNAAFEADLMRGLELKQDEVCQELGSQSCIRAVHTVALGGNDPFGSGLLRPAASSLSTTPLAVDRVTLSACSQRARADKLGSPKVFTSLDLSGPAPPPGSEAAKATITTLFRRLLARDPKSSELVTVAGVSDGEMTAEDFATLSCFIVASSLEALFF